MPDKKYRVIDILGRRTELGSAVVRAFRERKAPPSEIARAVKARYIKRTMAALRSRPNHGAQVLYTYAATVSLVPLADIPARLALAFDRRIKESDHVTLESVLRALEFVDDPAVAPVVGFCLSRTHTVHPAARTYTPAMTYRTDLPPTDEVVRWLSMYDLVSTRGPGEPWTTEPVIAEHTTPLLGVCVSHQGITCPICNQIVQADAQSTSTLLYFHDRGCSRCSSKDWLVFKKPSKFQPSQARPWMVTARQFAASL